MKVQSMTCTLCLEGTCFHRNSLTKDGTKDLAVPLDSVGAAKKSPASCLNGLSLASFPEKHCSLRKKGERKIKH